MKTKANENMTSWEQMKMQLIIKLSHFRDTWTHLCCCMEPGLLLVDEEGVRHPDELDVVRPHHQLLEPPLRGNRGSQGPSQLGGTGYRDKDILLQLCQKRPVQIPKWMVIFCKNYLLSVFLLPFLKSVSFQKLSVSNHFKGSFCVRTFAHLWTISN